jgi:HK97 family phage portal protein
MLRWFSLSPSPRDDFWYGPARRMTVAGVEVDESAALTYSACWAATRLLATSGSMIPLKLFRKLPGGGSEPASDSRRYYLVHDQINPDMTPMMFRSTRLAQQINWGNCFGEIEFARGGQAVAIHPIHPRRIPKDNIKRDGGGIYYLVNNDDGTKTRLEAWEVFHVPSPISDDGIWGLGVVEHARLTIGFGIATETQGAAYMGNSARPTVVIEGGKFKDKTEREEYRRQWSEVYGGPANNAKPALMPPEAKLHTLAFSAEDSQFLQTRQHNVEEIARWYGVPPHLIGHLLRSTYNNIEHQSLEFVKYSLMPWLVLWEQELNRKLLSPEERRTLFFRHVVDGLERGDLTTRTQALKEQFFNGKITLNEWRALDDQNPIGPEGDLHFVQQAMIPLEIAAKGPQQPAATQTEPDEADEESEESPDEEEMAARMGKTIEMLTAVNDRLAAVESTRHEHIAAATLDVVEDVLRLMLERESRDATEAARQPSSFLKWMDDFYAGHAKRMHLAMAKPLKACLVAAGAGEAIDDKVAAAIGLHITAGREALLQAASVQADQFPKSVESCVSTWQRNEIITYLGAFTNGNN